MGLRAWNVGLLTAICAVWLASGTQREKAVLADGVGGDHVRALEAEVSTRPADIAARRELAQAYLDARVPGLAIRLVESTPEAVRHAPALDHVYARALLDEGRSTDALAAERRVLVACNAEGATCDSWLRVAATRREEILTELVGLGVDDAQAHPEASAIAYHNATREAKLALQ